MTGGNVVFHQLRGVLVPHGEINFRSKWWIALATLWGVLFVAMVALAGILLWIRIPMKDWSNFAKLPLFGLAASAAILLCMALVAIAKWLTQQFQPTHAALVPHLRIRLRQAAVLFCLSIASVSGLLVALFIPDLRFVLMWLGALGISLGLVIAARQGLFMVIFFSCVFGLLIDHPSVQSWTDSIKNIIAVPLIGIPAGFAVLLVTVYWTYALRGDGHIAIAKSTSSMQWAAANDLKVFSPATLGTPVRFLRYLTWLLRGPTAQTGQAHFPLAFGPRYHWVSALSSTLKINLAIVGLLLVLGLFMTDERLSHWSLLITLQLAVVQALQILLFLDQASTAINQTRAEQGLLVLAERAPALAQQSSRLIPYLLRQYMVVWATTTAMIAGFGLWTESPVLGFSLVMCLSFAMLPCTTFLIRNYAVDDYAQRLSRLRKGLVPVFAMTAALMVVAIFAHFRHPALWCMGMVGCTAGLWYWRWKQVTRGGGLMLPAGRAG